MFNPRQSIMIQGEVVEILISPSMYKKSLVKDLDLTLHNPEDVAEIWQIYVKHIFLAYRNALDVAKYQGIKTHKKVFSLEDFEAWASTDGKQRFAEVVAIIVEAKTGKTLDEISGKDNKQVKKKR